MAPVAQSSSPPPQASLGLKPGERCLAVLDFDQTLASSEVSYFEAESDDVLEAVFGGSARHAQLSAFLNDLISRGVVLAIVSFNSAQLIKRVLSAAGWTDHFDERIFGSDEVHRYNYSKALCISHALIKPLLLAPEDVIFVDDCAHNCRTVMELGVKAVHVNRKGGMGEPEVDAVRKWLESRALNRASFTDAVSQLAVPSAVKELPV